MKVKKSKTYFANLLLFGLFPLSIHYAPLKYLEFFFYNVTLQFRIKFNHFQPLYSPTIFFIFLKIYLLHLSNPIRFFLFDFPKISFFPPLSLYPSNFNSSNLYTFTPKLRIKILIFLFPTYLFLFDYHLYNYFLLISSLISLFLIVKPLTNFQVFCNFFKFLFSPFPIFLILYHKLPLSLKYSSYIFHFFLEQIQFFYLSLQLHQKLKYLLISLLLKFI